jgi:hypothetical protein
MAAPLEVAQATRRHRSALFNVDQQLFNVKIGNQCFVESLAKQISVANREPSSVRGKRRVAPMTVNIPGSSLAEIKFDVIELKLNRLIEEMRFLKSRMIAFDRQLNEIEACLKPGEQQPDSKPRPWFAAASATARTVLILFAVGAATGAALLYLGT